jgi:lipopolysaccharide/colanic/teichoic acid biosynthesis glycosyltransferase
VKLDYVYVTNWSLWWDIKILVQTLPTVLKRQGAY